MSKTFSRFYTKVTIDRADDGHAIHLDGRAVKTPGTRAPLVVPTRPLAAAVAEEWRRQEETVDPNAMPQTALACTAIDLADRRAEITAALAAYADTDLLCHRVPAPPALAERQQDLWQPWLDWAALTYDARLNVTTALLPAEQPPESKQAFSAAIAGMETFPLAALSATVKATGSLVLGLALVTRELDPDRAFELAELEATHEIESWGEDAEARKRREALYAELQATNRFVALLDGDEVVA